MFDFHQILIYHATGTDIEMTYFGVAHLTVGQAHSLTNWEASSLTPQQQTYAALDSWACLHVYKHLESGRFDAAESPFRVVPELETNHDEK